MNNKLRIERKGHALPHLTYSYPYRLIEFIVIGLSFTDKNKSHYSGTKQNLS